LFFLLVGHAFADVVYMQTDNEGNPVYSDSPLNQNAQRIIAPPVSEVNSSKPATSKTTTNTQTTNIPPNKPYTVFAMESPKNEETIQNQHIIPVSIKIEPALQEGDKVLVLIDGAPWGEPQASTQLQFTAPDRGTHSLSAKLLDKNGQVLKQTNSITVYIHQAHLGGSV